MFSLQNCHCCTVNYFTTSSVSLCPCDLGCIEFEVVKLGWLLSCEPIIAQIESLNMIVILTCKTGILYYYVVTV